MKDVNIIDNKTFENYFPEHFLQDTTLKEKKKKKI